jgi:hypothetical protein
MKIATIYPSMGWVSTEHPGFWQRATQIESVYEIDRYVVEEKTTGAQVHKIYLVEVEDNEIVSITCVHED